MKITIAMMRRISQMIENNAALWALLTLNEYEQCVISSALRIKAESKLLKQEPTTESFIILRAIDGALFNDYSEHEKRWIKHQGSLAPKQATSHCSGFLPAGSFQKKQPLRARRNGAARQSQCRINAQLKGKNLSIG